MANQQLKNWKWLCDLRKCGWLFVLLVSGLYDAFEFNLNSCCLISVQISLIQFMLIWNEQLNICSQVEKMNKQTMRKKKFKQALI